jgi:hypothetical protein
MTGTIAYEETGKSGEIEFRKYPEMVLATVDDPGNDSGFSLLFGYITGRNRVREKIPMTAPVMTSEQIPMTAPVITSEQIPMTAPVINSEQIPMTAPVITSEQIPMTAPVVSGRHMMSFVMPEGKTLQEMPEPLDTRVQLTSVPPREIAVIRFTGYARRDDVEGVKTRLLDGLNRAGIATRGSPFLMRYNAPWTPGFLRRNEVGIEITR